MKTNVENSVNAEMPIPSRASQEEGVETMHDAPRTGEEIVRTDGNRNRQRQAEMTCPLERQEEYHLSSQKATECKDVQDDITSGVGTYAVPDGITEDYFRKGFNGTVYGANIFEDNNITIDATPDCKSFVFARDGLILVEGHDLRKESKRLPEYGGGADQLFIYDEYAYGERLALATTGAWLAELLGDATAPA